MKHACKTCAEYFYDKPCRKRVYCSRQCATKDADHLAVLSEAHLGQKAWNKGKNLPEETKAKLSVANTKRYEDPAERRKFGLRMEKWRASLSESEKTTYLDKSRSSKPRGKDHWRWKGGGVSESRAARATPEYRKWRKEVYERDGYACQCCGAKGVSLHPHHIKNFSSYLEGRFDVNNGITLCVGCHKAFHKEFGRVSNSREQLADFLSAHLSAIPIF